MLKVDDLIRYFGVSLNDPNFQLFLSKYFSDLCEYNPAQSDYIVSESTGVELGFTNETAVIEEDEQIVFEPGNPVFSHFNLYPKSKGLVIGIPLDIKFAEKRKEFIHRAGQPTKSFGGFSQLLKKEYLIDHYKLGDTVISIDYEPKGEEIIQIQIRHNNLVRHLQL